MPVHPICEVRMILLYSIEMDTSECPVTATLEVIGGKWKPLIIYYLRSGSKRFNELRRAIPGVTQRMLTAHLRELERDGIVERYVHAVIPPRVDYQLSDLGRSLTPMLDQMAKWGLYYLARNEPVATVSSMAGSSTALSPSAATAGLPQSPDSPTPSRPAN
jgi:DNA-binding HxlR family transcriptional regulator